jgi:hypothetical protein
MSRNDCSDCGERHGVYECEVELGVPDQDSHDSGMEGSE